MTLAVLKNEYSIPTFTFAALIVQISDLFLYNSPIDINWKETRQPSFRLYTLYGTTIGNGESIDSVIEVLSLLACWKMKLSSIPVAFTTCGGFQYTQLYETLLALGVTAGESSVALLD
ncbi:hypothetical protein ACI3LZ_004767 [Candidozyma auris]